MQLLNKLEDGKKVYGRSQISKEKKFVSMSQKARNAKEKG
jgi:hypothetical protein